MSSEAAFPAVLAIHCWLTNDPKCYQLTTSHNYYLTVSVVQESVDDLAWFSGSEYLTNQPTRWWPRSKSPPSSTGTWCTWQLTQWLLEGVRSLRAIGLKASVPHYLLTRGRSLLLVTWVSPKTSSQYGSWLHQCEQMKESKREGVCKHNGSHSLLWANLWSDLPLFGCFLLVRSKSLDPVHKLGEWAIQGKEIPQEYEYQKAGILGEGRASYKATYYNCPVLGMWKILEFGLLFLEHPNPG